MKNTIQHENCDISICYFGNYDPSFSRNSIYISGLKQIGVRVVECHTSRGHLMKYIDLCIKHWKIRHTYDYIIVGYPDRLSVILAKIISRKPVIFNALCSMYEIVVISRSQFSEHSMMATFYKSLDYIAVKCADMTFVETENQRDYFINHFGAHPETCHKLYTGVDDSIFYIDPTINKQESFTVLFRGKFLPEAGVRHIVEAAKLLEKSGVSFLLLGGGPSGPEIERVIQKLAPKNITLIPKRLSPEDLRMLMLSSHVSLGQFENNERLDRTIPHKAGESLAMKLPYITGKSKGISELLTDGESCLMVNLADAQALAMMILKLRDDPVLMRQLAENGYQIYKKYLTPSIIAHELIKLCQSILR